MWRCLRILVAFAATQANGEAMMSALLATSSSKYGLGEEPIPLVGKLHRTFENLPRSCEVLVDVHQSSVNPADLYVSGKFPQIMGSDIAGTVRHAGSDCKRLKAGDKVWADIGAVAHYKDGVKAKENGGYAQVAVALESQLGAMPANIDFPEAGSLPKVALTSWKALNWYGGAPYKSAVTVLILGGSGGTGTTGIQLAKAYGASQIITTTSIANADYVKELGATQAIDYRSQNWWEVLPSGSVDVVYDCVGQTGTGDRAMKVLRSGGFYVTLRGALPTKPRADVQSHGFINSDTNLDNVDILDKLKDLVEADKLRMRKVKTYPLENILDAFAESSAGHVVGKLSISMPPLGQDSIEELRI